MASKQRPQGHRAGRPGARKTKSTRKASVEQSGRTSKARSIPLSQLSRRRYAARHRPVSKPPRLEDLSPRQLSDYLDSLAVLADARRGYAFGLDAEGQFSRIPIRGIRHAARVRKVPFYKIERYVGSELFRDRKGRIQVTPADRRPRPMPIPTALGDQTVVVRGSRKASLLAKIRIALLVGDEAEFERLRNKLKNHRIAGQGLPDFRTLQAALDAGAVDPAEMYAAAQGGGAR